MTLPAPLPNWDIDRITAERADAIAAYGFTERQARFLVEEETMKIWLNVAEAAEYSGVSRDTIDTACERGELRHARIGGRRAIRMKAEWIDAWLEQHSRGAEASRIAARSSAHGVLS